MKGSGWLKIKKTLLFCSFTFSFLSQLSVCLCVSRVRAYLTTNQHTRRLQGRIVGVSLDNDNDYLLDFPYPTRVLAYQQSSNAFLSTMSQSLGPI
jgi:hypothetical protein